MGEDALSVKTTASPYGHLLFGVGSLHHLPLRTQRLRILHQALDMGFRRFDVAPTYGNGLNELDLGCALHRYGKGCQVTTKFGIPVDLYGARYPHLFFLLRTICKLSDSHHGNEYKQRIFSGAEMLRSLEGSLRRLRRECVDDFFIHEPLGLLTKSEVSDLHQQANRLKEQGKILRFGVCGPAASIDQFVDDPAIDVFQFPLEDSDKVKVVPPRRLIAYSVYHTYLASASSKSTTFSMFVRERLNSSPMDLILATTSSTKLALLRECF